QFKLIHEPARQQLPERLALAGFGERRGWSLWFLSPNEEVEEVRHRDLRLYLDLKVGDGYQSDGVVDFHRPLIASQVGDSYDARCLRVLVVPRVGFRARAFLVRCQMASELAKFLNLALV